jgi:hypothetical protein
MDDLMLASFFPADHHHTIRSSPHDQIITHHMIRSSPHEDIDEPRLIDKMVVCPWKGLFGQGCVYDHGQIAECTAESATLLSMPPILITWIPREAHQQWRDQKDQQLASIPIYFNQRRESFIGILHLPCSGKPSKWTLMGTCLVVDDAI